MREEKDKEKKEPQTTIDALPKFVLQYMASFLDPKSLSSLTKVSKKFRSILFTQPKTFFKAITEKPLYDVDISSEKIIDVARFLMQSNPNTIGLSPKEVYILLASVLQKMTNDYNEACENIDPIMNHLHTFMSVFRTLYPVSAILMEIKIGTSFLYGEHIDLEQLKKICALDIIIHDTNTDQKEIAEQLTWFNTLKIMPALSIKENTLYIEKQTADTYINRRLQGDFYIDPNQRIEKRSKHSVVWYDAPRANTPKEKKQCIQKEVLHYLEKHGFSLSNKGPCIIL